jgi:hypothetical protein
MARRADGEEKMGRRGARSVADGFFYDGSVARREEEKG